VPAPTPFGSVIRTRRLQHGFRNCYLAVTLAAGTQDRWSGGGTGSRTEPGRRRPGALLADPAGRTGNDCVAGWPESGPLGRAAVLVVPARMTGSGLLAHPRQNLSRPGAGAPGYASRASASPGSVSWSSAGPRSARKPGARSPPVLPPLVLRHHPSIGSHKAHVASPDLSRSRDQRAEQRRG